MKKFSCFLTPAARGTACDSFIRCLAQRLMGVLILVATVAGQAAWAQTPQNVVIPTGSFIVNMGVMPQTVANGLKPYGLVYALLQAKCPVEWVINQAKTKDGTDFSYNGVAYKGGTFIIRAEYRTAAVNALITTWQSFGVQGVTTTSPVTVPVYLTFWNVPKWTMDKQNGSIATAFFTNAGIPASAYGGSSTFWKIPADLNCCDDIFVMPHADPIWLTHRRLYDWVGSGTNGCKGGVWLGCHAGSALENMFDNITTDGDPIDPSQQTNFLVEKTANAVSAGPWSDPGNSLILWGAHDDGTLPYTFNTAYAADPVAQYMGSTDAAQLNGSEQIYIPAHASAGWRPQTRVLAYDPDHPDAKSYPSTPMTHKGAVLAYGPGFGVTGNGKVFLEAAHNIAGTAPANVAAQRAFFNFSFLVAWEKAVIPELTGLPDTMYSGTTYNLGFTYHFNTPGGTYNIQSITWTASCGGTWNTSSSNPTTYTAPANSGAPIVCSISVTIVDDCGRTTFDTHQAVIAGCKINATAAVTQPSCFGGGNGSIAITSSNWASPYNWSWTRSNPAGGPVSGTGTTITGLSAGTYSVTLSNASPACSGTFTAQVNQPAQLIATTAVTNASCYGLSNGSVNLTGSGGTPAFTYLWSPGGAITEDLVNVAAGTYNVTVTDSKGCTATAAATVGQPAAALTVPGVVTNLSCYGGSDGAINITATGGTSPYTYDWGGGITAEDRTGLSAGTYNVVVTDANGCTTSGSFAVNQPAMLTVSVAKTDPTCDATPPDFDGTINITVAGGASPYTYDWADLGTPGVFTDPEDRSGLSAGTYTVTVKDAQGCTATATTTLTALHTDPVAPTIINH